MPWLLTFRPSASGYSTAVASSVKMAIDQLFIAGRALSIAQLDTQEAPRITAKGCVAEAFGQDLHNYIRDSAIHLRTVIR